MKYPFHLCMGKILLGGVREGWLGHSKYTLDPLSLVMAWHNDDVHGREMVLWCPTID